MLICLLEQSREFGIFRKSIKMVWFVCQCEQPQSRQNESRLREKWKLVFKKGFSLEVGKKIESCADVKEQKKKILHIILTVSRLIPIKLSVK